MNRGTDVIRAAWQQAHRTWRASGYRIWRIFMRWDAEEYALARGWTLEYTQAKVIRDEQH